MAPKEDGHDNRQVELMLSWKNIQPAWQFEVFNAFLFLPRNGATL